MHTFAFGFVWPALSIYRFRVLKDVMMGGALHLRLTSCCCRPADVIYNGGALRCLQLGTYDFFNKLQELKSPSNFQTSIRKNSKK
jgi:hypothetical protein